VQWAEPDPIECNQWPDRRFRNRPFWAAKCERPTRPPQYLARIYTTTIDNETQVLGSVCCSDKKRFWWRNEKRASPHHLNFSSMLRLPQALRWAWMIRDDLTMKKDLTTQTTGL
jgi:hypothetical protein